MTALSSATPSSLQLGAYAVLALPLAMALLPVSVLVPQLYAQDTALTLTAVGAILLAARLIDAVVDPLIGAWIDRMKSSGGYRLPVLIGAPVLVLGFALVFNPPAWDGLATALWLFAALACAHLGYSIASIAYGAWGAGLAHDDAGRARVTGIREAVGLVGVVLGAALPALIGTSVLPLVLLVAMVLALWSLRAAPLPHAVPGRGALGGGGAVQAVARSLGSARLRWLLGVFALNAMAPAITATVFQFYVADRLGAGPPSALFLVLYFLAGAASMPIWIALTRRYALPVIWLGGMAAAVCAFIGAAFLDTGQFAAFGLICVLSGLALGADLALPPALLARVIDADGESGRREGAYFGLWNFVNKLILALAGAAALFALEQLGYRPGDARGAGEALTIVYGLLPCVFKLLAAGLLLFAWRRGKF